MAKFAAIIRVEDTLSQNGEVTGNPGLPAKILVRTLATQMHLFFRTELPDSQRERVSQWLQVELGVTAPKIISDDDPIRVVRYLGWDVQMYIDAQPSECAAALQQGVTAILLASPAYLRPEFRPEARSRAPQEWAKLEAVIEEERTARANDPRTNDELRDRRFGD